MAEITCAERDQLVRDGVASGELTVYSGSTNFMGNGLVETTWGTTEGEREVLYEVKRYAPGTWPDPKGVESCTHYLREADRE